ncbi:tektin-2 [Oryzias melastigma]|nr:tektin-2 [Oryzias melastigma]
MLPVKPALRCSVSEWNNNNLQLWAEAQQQRQVSGEIRQECRSLRNETHSKTVWDEKETSRRLTERVWDVSRWRDLLQSCAQKVDEEMDALTLSKELTEQALAATATPLEVSTECLMLREGRRGYELVADPVEEQLQKEVELIERVQRTLQQHIDEAFQQLCILQEARHQLTADLQNKTEALDIDKSCLTLTIASPHISLKTNPTRIPSGSSTPQEWVQLSSHNVVQAEEAMRSSQQMREDMSLSRAQLQNELEAESRATEFALRKRSHHEEQARDELQWQIRNTEAEIAEMESDIQELDADLQAKTAPLKLAHTRLENRTRRPGGDLCRDEVQHSLVAEVEQLEATVLALQQKLSKAQHSLQNLRLHHDQMLQDLSRKQEALSLEQRSLSTRTRLTSGSNPVRVVAPAVPLMNSCGRSNLQLLAE